MAQFARKRKKKVEVATLSTKEQHVIVCFGPPGSGVSSICETLQKASNTAIALIEYTSPSAFADIENALKNADIVLVDVDAGVFSEHDVQAFVDSGLISPVSGAFVRIHTFDDEILRRLKEAGREDYVDAEDLAYWNSQIDPVEARIRLHSIKYFMIPNISLEEAVTILALRCSLQD